MPWLRRWSGGMHAHALREYQRCTWRFGDAQHNQPCSHGRVPERRFRRRIWISPGATTARGPRSARLVGQPCGDPLLGPRSSGPRRTPFGCAVQPCAAVKSRQAHRGLQRPFSEVRARSVSACTTHTPGEMDPCGLYNDTVAALRACATRGCVAATSGPASQIAATPEPMPQRTHPGAPMGFEEGADGRIATNRLWGGRSSSLKPQDTPRSSNEGSARDASMHERCVRICKSWKPDVRTSSIL